MIESIIKKASDAVFGQPLVSNNYRGLLVEAIVAEALGEYWNWVSGDWAAWDLESADGKRLEVKQSAALQSWHHSGFKKSTARFDCATRTGRWEGASFLKEAGRFADIYIFAYHGIADAKVADHRIPEQWTFFVTLVENPPEQKTIGLNKVRKISIKTDYDNLKNTVQLLVKE